mmetsp:Transcript_21049/g.53340  ORF Transcript_21049/g.53340 Transcript_21049/m.53340 type:complete len:161 (+) Transcript_21049:235-717(+)
MLRQAPSGRRRERPQLSAEQERELQEAFELFDADCTGTIDYHELKVAIRALGFPISRGEAYALAEEHDTEGVGAISLRQFLDIMTSMYATRDPVEELDKAFELFDTDKKGHITVKNLRRIAHDLGEEVSESELQAMIDEFDRNLDGALDKAEFARMLSGT